MRRGALAALLLAPLLLAPAPRDPLGDALRSIRAHQLRAHTWFLSHDRLRGRAPGTPGAETAALYVAGQFARSGLEPPPGGFLQPVPLRGTTVDSATVRLVFRHGAAAASVRYGADAVVWPGDGADEIDLEGRLTFVGYGIAAPEYGWDDYAGRDVRGRVLLILSGDPPTPPEEPDLFGGADLTWYGRWTYKLEEARRRGAAGALLIHSTESVGYGWPVVERSWTGERLELRGPDIGPGGLRVEGWLRQPAAAGVLELAGLDLARLTAGAARRDFVPIATGIEVRAAARAQSRQFESHNVAGLVPGSDPRLRNEFVVVVAHYDHLGIRAAQNGDSVYNGAYDNASGVATLLETAEALAALSPRTARSVLFLATTAEEEGLLGAQHYVRDPLVPIERTVAALNVDGANLWGETHDAIGLGGGRSTLGDVLRREAGRMLLDVSPERGKEGGYFFRSDHFPFARAGVPALQLEHGVRFRGRPPAWGEAVLQRYALERYHAPGDELDPAMDFGGMVQQARLLLRVCHAVATQPARPRWKAGGRPPG